MPIPVTPIDRIALAVRIPVRADPLLPRVPPVGRDEQGEGRVVVPRVQVDQPGFRVGAFADPALGFAVGRPRRRRLLAEGLVGDAPRLCARIVRRDPHRGEVVAVQEALRRPDDSRVGRDMLAPGPGLRRAGRRARGERDLDPGARKRRAGLPRSGRRQPGPPTPPTPRDPPPPRRAPENRPASPGAFRPRSSRSARPPSARRRGPCRAGGRRGRRSGRVRSLRRGAGP